MLTMRDDKLVFRFPDVHEDANLRMDFRRTLRVPDDGKTYPLPAGLGSFPLRHLEDFGEKLPEKWRQRGGALMPMYQSEAMWIDFSGSYPMAVIIAAGKINAVTGKPWVDGLNDDPQDYVTTPRQPWLDGFATGEDQVKQFVASRLGDGQTAEEQLTGAAEFGGLQIIVYPLKLEIYEQERADRKRRQQESQYLEIPTFLRRGSPSQAMGLGLGGSISQSVYKDERGSDVWDKSSSRCFVHIINSQEWQDITNEPVPHTPMKKADYKKQRIPWFSYYDDRATALSGSPILQKLKTFAHFQEPGSEAMQSMKISKLFMLWPGRRGD